MNKELVVVIAHYNNPAGLKASLRSIRETVKVDVLIVDDGSDLRFNEEEIRALYAMGDISFDYLAENSGVGVAANRGLQIAQQKGYQFIGRLDCGDICYSGKYEIQLDYLKKNPEVKLLGTWARVVDMEGNLQHMLKHPTDYQDLRKKMYFNSMFLNPSVVFYAEILDTVGNYPYKYRRAAQDYAFFFKVIQHFKAENLPMVLMDYVIEPHSISTTKRRLQVKHRMQIILEHFYLGYYPIAGLLRSAVLYLLPRSTTTAFKRLLKRH